MLPDDEFLREFFAPELPNSDFNHCDHLRLAWLVAQMPGRGWLEPDLVPLPF